MQADLFHIWHLVFGIGYLISIFVYLRGSQNVQTSPGSHLLTTGGRIGDTPFLPQELFVSYGLNLLGAACWCATGAPCGFSAWLRWKIESFHGSSHDFGVEI